GITHSLTFQPGPKIRNHTHPKLYPSTRAEGPQRYQPSAKRWGYIHKTIPPGRRSAKIISSGCGFHIDHLNLNQNGPKVHNHVRPARIR
ncbi:hypothetical protein P0Y35_19010, partial [Kiritimatiellaeota bacterium B1221]|nr:hypothetical protein [Kiritimatiellaeota bacterium B1221]